MLLSREAFNSIQAKELIFLKDTVALEIKDIELDHELSPLKSLAPCLSV